MNNDQISDGKMPSVWDRTSQWVKNSITLKILGIGFLLLLMLIPLEMVEDIIHERKRFQENTIQQVTDDWAQYQTITGPILMIPFNQLTYYKNAKTGETTASKTAHWASFLPEELNIEGELLPETRHRGIYEVSVYKSNIELEGKFIEPDFDFGFDSIEVDYSKAQVVFGVSDSRGIESQVQLQSSVGTTPYSPGVGACQVVERGVHFKVDLTGIKELEFKIPLQLKGSYGLNMLPLGKSTKAHISGNWADPKFRGAHLPDKHTIENELQTFDANWEVLDLNRSFPQKFLANNLQTNGESFGVELHMPLSQYQKNMRAAKYAVLFIALTFLCFFFVQVIKKIKIHFVQCLLVGFALCLFYVLLLSFSEVIGFNYAYLIATTAVILQIGFYIRAVTKSTKISLMLSSLLALLYTFVFSIIQMEERSLLFGSIGLFIILGAIMYLSRSVQWNNMAKE